MPSKIIDQFTDLPISSNAKWRLRHPEKDKSNKRSDYLKMRADPERYASRVASLERATKRHNGKVAIARVLKKRDFRNSLMKRDKLVAEAKRHHKLGRDVGTICVWMNLPESKVRELLS